MDSKAGDLLGAGGAVLSTVLYVAPRAINFVNYTYYSYNKKSMQQMAAFQAAYLGCCYGVERDSPYSTLEVTPKAPDLIDPQELKKYPLFFIMDKEQKELPRVYLDGFLPNTDSSTWEKMTGITTLSNTTQDLIAYICEYQIVRNKGCTYKETINREEPFLYDPINLFCEELKTWLIKLGQCQIEEKTKQHVQARIRYLEAIYLNNKVFSQVYAQDPFLPTVLYLKNAFENDIFRNVLLALSKKSAREYFYEMCLSNRALIKKMVGYLFYIFKDAEEIPENFSIQQVSKPTLGTYRSALNNVSSKILQHLINHSLFIEAYVIKDSNQAGDEEVSSKNCLFIEHNGVSKLPSTLIYHGVKSDWYLDKQSNSGILEPFRTRTIIEAFIRIHGYVEKLSAFCLTVQALYELAGEVGNLTLYGCAVSRILDIFDSFERLTKEIREDLAYLTSQADMLYGAITGNSKSVKKTKSTEQWSNISYKAAITHKNDIYEYFDNILKNIGQIKILIQAINHPQYAQKIKKRFESLFGYMELFSPIKEVQPQFGRVFHDSKAFKIGEDQSNCKQVNSSPQDYEAEFKQLNMLLDENPDNYELRVKQMYCLYRSDKEQYSELCILNLKSLLEESPSNQLTLFTLASVLYELNSIAESMSYLTQLLCINPDHAEAKELYTSAVAKKNALYSIGFNR